MEGVQYVPDIGGGDFVKVKNIPTQQEFYIVFDF